MSNTPSKTAALRWGGLANTGSNTEEDLLQIQAQVPGALIQAWIDSSGTPWGNLRIPGPAGPAGAPGGGINVKAAPYNATGNAQSVTDAIASGTNTVTSATANFLPADVGKMCYGVYSPDGSLHVPQTTITAVVNANTITVAATVSASGVQLNFVWGTDDTAALKAAWQAAIAAANTITGGLGGMQNVYVPTGGYIFSYLPFNSVQQGSKIPSPGPSLLGDGPFKTVFYPTPNYNFATGGFQSGFGMLLQSFNGGTASEVGKFSVWGANIEFNAQGAVVDLSSVPYAHDVSVTTFGKGSDSGSGIGGFYCTEGCTGVWSNIRTVGINGSGNHGIYVNGSHANCLMLNCGTSNGGDFVLNGVNGGQSYTNETGGVTLVGVLNDESNGGISFINCSRCQIIGCSLYGNAGSLPLYIDGTSDVVVLASNIGTYSYDTSCIAVEVAAGGILRLGSTQIYSQGVSGSAVALINAGTIFDLGGNTIASITNTGTIQQSSYNNTAASATEGSASALPALPAGYTIEVINGAPQKRPYYNV
jgi:hypothetical protein